MAGPSSRSKETVLIDIQHKEKLFVVATTEVSIHTGFTVAEFLKMGKEVKSGASKMPLRSHGCNVSMALTNDRDMSYLELIDEMIKALKAAKDRVVEWSIAASEICRKGNEADEAAFCSAASVV